MGSHAHGWALSAIRTPRSSASLHPTHRRDPHIIRMFPPMGTTKRGRKSKQHHLPLRRPPMEHPGAGEPLESEGEGLEVSRGNKGEAK
ncbi:hypothetical protein AXF42_Ash014889 [Apostasia shenzhenica]|uniref:Uncharacterized protein n=1 Tax=Apostasia shenzhenica TaxID=1088818 RepID=A0A2I0ALP9_9ASPA|nr:hypothetical protein AXF42_Ash014889 [Apostasia shenzhenica]